MRTGVTWNWLRSHETSVYNGHQSPLPYQGRGSSLRDIRESLTFLEMGKEARVFWKPGVLWQGVALGRKGAVSCRKHPCPARKTLEESKPFVELSVVLKDNRPLSQHKCTCCLVSPRCVPVQEYQAGHVGTGPHCLALVFIPPMGCCRRYPLPA